MVHNLTTNFHQKLLKIAILGAGYAGLATAWHLLHEFQYQVMIDIFDPLPIGCGASGISSGLLHPFAGMHAKKSWEADSGMNATHELISESVKAGHSPVVLSKGIFRPATSEQTRNDFQKQAEKDAGVEWWDPARIKHQIPSIEFGDLPYGGGIYVKEGMTIDVTLYLQGLWQACARGGARLIQKAVTDYEQISCYDQIIFAIGHQTDEFLHFPIKKVKGQILKLKWPKGLPPLPFSLIGKGYLVMAEEGSACYAGATFERSFASLKPEGRIAKQLILEKILPFFPKIQEMPIMEVKAGVRATTSSHLPLVDQIEEKFWILTALGSKGLLWHAFLGKRLAQAILNNDLSFLPQEARHASHSPARSTREPRQQD
ncbi:MAG: FAD-binding oxidoreductase [Chlamydiia bacterium]|nr:FAD-binding oxidoreductase [Chlamydiia bacterium]